MKSIKTPVFEQLNRNVQLFLKDKISFGNLTNSIQSKRMRKIFLDCFDSKKSNPFYQYQTDKKGWGRIYFLYCEQAILCREKNQLKIQFFNHAKNS